MKNLESSIRGLINEETITEGGHHDVISAKNQIKIARDALDKMERGLSGLDDEGSLPSWWTNKVAIAIDKLDGMSDYLSTQIDEAAIRENLQSMDNDKAKDIYDKLRKGSIVEVKIGNAIASQLKPIRLVVTSGHRIVGKSKVGRILLVDVENPRGMKYKLFDRDGTIRLAQSDMATILKDMKIVKK